MRPPAGVQTVDFDPYIASPTVVSSLGVFWAAMKPSSLQAADILHKLA